MIVVLVIGILAAIAIPNYLSLRERASEAGVKSNMHTVQLHAEDYGLLNDGVFADVMDATHIGNTLPDAFANPYNGSQGPGASYENRDVYVGPPSAITGIVSYSDSANATYNVKGQVKGKPLALVLSDAE